MKFIRKIDLDRLQANHPVLYNWERKTSELFHPGTSVFRLFLYKTRVIFEFIYLGSIQFRYIKNLRALREISQSKNDREALLIGNGPSANTLNIDLVKRLQAEQSLDIFGINFCRDFCVKNGLEPDYIVLSDPHFINEPNDHRVIELIFWLTKNKNITILVPMHWKNIFLKNFLLENSVLYFNDLNLRGWSKNINPLKPRGYISLTAYKSISLSAFLGYRKINMIGIDNSLYLKFSVDEHNTLWQESFHFSENYHGRIDISRDFPRGTVDYFYSLSNCFLDLQMFKSLPVVNLDSRSVIDTFAKKQSGLLLNIPGTGLLE
jgi:hypothetical protein